MFRVSKYNNLVVKCMASGFLWDTAHQDEQTIKVFTFSDGPFLCQVQHTLQLPVIEDEGSFYLVKTTKHFCKTFLPCQSAFSFVIRKLYHFNLNHCNVIWHCWVSNVNKQNKQNMKTGQKGGWPFELLTEQNSKQANPTKQEPSSNNWIVMRNTLIQQITTALFH